MSTRLVTDPAFLEHDTGPMHPEAPRRLRAIAEVLQERPIEGSELVFARPATRHELLRVHHNQHVEGVLALTGQHAQLDPDTALSPGSTDAALKAAGAAAQLALEVWTRSATNGFALVRPPGHHAEANRAMGFCVFNNVAVAAAAGLAAGAQRVLIVDFDVHHGNGTQHVFAGRSDVMFASVHQFPFYPGTGSPEEVGIGRAKGHTINVAFPGGQYDADYGAAFHDVVLPRADAFAPDLVLVSAGFDAHQADPIGGMNVTERGFAAMCTELKALAERHAQGRLALVLEGGYDVEALSNSVHACVEVLTGARKETFPSGVSKHAAKAIAATTAALAP